MNRKLKTIVIGIALLFAVYLNPLHGQSNRASTDFYVPSVFKLIFGDVTTSDIALQKVGASVLGVSGNLGGTGATSNTTITPAGPFAWGTVALSSNTATVTFSKAFASAPVCVVTDQTTAQLVKAAPTSTTVVITDTVGASDVVAWACFGNPN